MPSRLLAHGPQAPGAQSLPPDAIFLQSQLPRVPSACPPNVPSARLNCCCISGAGGGGSRGDGLPSTCPHSLMEGGHPLPVRGCESLRTHVTYAGTGSHSIWPLPLLGDMLSTAGAPSPHLPRPQEPPARRQEGPAPHTHPAPSLLTWPLGFGLGAGFIVACSRPCVLSRSRHLPSHCPH